MMNIGLANVTLKTGESIERIRKLRPVACISCLTGASSGHQMVNYFLEILILVVVDV